MAHNKYIYFEHAKIADLASVYKIVLHVKMKYLSHDETTDQLVVSLSFPSKLMEYDLGFLEPAHMWFTVLSVVL